MKKLLPLFAAWLFCMNAAAQNIAPAGIVNGKVHRPQTTVYIDITVRQQEITAGPYARYAQKYLGITAPLADKVLCEIISASVSDEKHVPALPALSTQTSTASHMNPENGFPKLLVDRTSNSALSAEDNARLAAAQIFKIRQSRIELITAEAGENVFGAGLQSALEELGRLEQEYLSLFLGRQTGTTVNRQYSVTPVQGKQTYIICRFSEPDGLLPEDDLSGQPVVLETKPRDTVSTEGLPVVEKPAKGDTAYRIADDAACRIILDNSEIAFAVLPVYQFGKTVYLR